MATELKLRRGTTAQHSTFTGAAGEITVDTDKKTVVVHDGVTAGGKPLLKAEQVSAFGLTLIDDADAAAARATLGAQASLGFTPVRQGGASGQDPGTTLLLGWDGSVGAITAQASALYLGRILHQRSDVTVRSMNLNLLTTSGVYQYEHANGENTGGPASQPGYGILVVLNTEGFCAQILFSGATGRNGPETVFYRCWYVPNGTGSTVWKKLSFTED